MSAPNSGRFLEEEVLELPAIEEDGEDDDVTDAYDGRLDLPRVRESEDETTTTLDDAALDIDFVESADAVSAIGDDAEGFEDDPIMDGFSIDESGASWVEGQATECGLEEDTSLGIALIPREVDDGGAEGVVDPGAEIIDAGAFPPLDDEESESLAEPELVLELPDQQSAD